MRGEGVVFVLALAFLVFNFHHLQFADGATSLPPGRLRRHFYNNTCHDVEEYIKHQVKLFWTKDHSITPKLLRLLYSDCFVTGCDASVLLDEPNSEKFAAQNIGLGGFKFIDLLKKVVEARCPGVVSCSDILNLATRDALHLAGAPSYPVLTGRRDGLTSKATSVDLPSPSITLESALSYFQSKGLDVLDFTTLMGAHTMGSTHCHYILDRLYNFNGSNKPDPSMEPTFLASMRAICPPKTKKGQGDPLAFLNPESGSRNNFSNSYYSRVLKKQAVLGIDQQLLYGDDTQQIALEFSGLFEDFRKSWALSMTRMGSIGVLTGKAGEIRRYCYTKNS